jgi:hypothetical protein
MLGAVQVLRCAYRAHHRKDDAEGDYVVKCSRSSSERLRAENAQLKRTANRGVSLKVSEKGGVSVYGRFPVTLYKEKWTKKLLDRADDILAFIRANDASLKTKS